MQLAKRIPPSLRRWRIWLLIVVFTGLWYAFWELNRPEPVYGDQPLSYWMERMADPATSAKASSVLREMGPEALPTLVDALHSRSSAASDFAYNLSVKLNLAPERNYDAPNIRATAAYLLGQMGKDAAPAVPDLVEALGDKDALVRLKSIRALAQIGEPSLSDLSDALARPEPDVRFGAAKALGAMGPRARSATNALTLCLNDAQPHVRLAATQALAAIRK